MVWNKKSVEQIKQEFRNVHGDRYVYDCITEDNYIDVHHNVPIICRKHGLFEQTPHNHLQGKGCRECALLKLKEPSDAKRKTVYGVGLCDVDFSVNLNKTTKEAYKHWTLMLRRCYSNRKEFSSYKDCDVCKDWLLFSNFYKWFIENYVDGYALDKDLICKGNKCYCPDYCCFIPTRINNLILRNKSRRGEYPIGVTKVKGMFKAQISENYKNVSLGLFNTPEEAFAAFKFEKERYVKELASEYYNKGTITEKVYNALMNYKVEITD